ncbi:MAG: NRDE family protein [Acidobacteriota bacterium]|nr:NRDE family protein [Acidobacteriota bacterium]
MCTVAFIPDADGGYILGHNRDELRARARGLPPARFERCGMSFLAPRDPDGGGTWIGVNASRMTLCLLNAAERDPTRLPAEPRSRGLLLWDVLPLGSADGVDARLEETRKRLAGIRAFHMVAALPGARGGEAVSVHWTWDGERLARERREGATMYVSSSYDQTAVEHERGKAWERLGADHRRPDEPALVRWLASEGETPGPFTVCMERPNAMTVSRTLVIASAGGVEMRYLDGPPCDRAAREWTAKL